MLPCLAPTPAATQLVIAEDVQPSAWRRASIEANAPVVFNIERQSLRQALVAFARQANVQILWTPDPFTDVLVGPVQSELAPDTALAILLAPTGATYEFRPNGVVTIDLPRRTRSWRRGERAPAGAAYAGPEGEPYHVLELDEIVITGTRLRSRTDDARFSLRPALTEDQLRRSGYNDTLDVVADLPLIHAPTTPVNTQLSIASSGQSFIELRSLDSNRALVLFDGRRSVSNSYVSNRVDLNTVPIDLVREIDIAKGGASAIYGADAIAGAVNISFIDDAQGLRVRTRGGISQQGGGEEVGASLLFGGGIADNRGHVTIYLGAEHEGPIAATDRDFALISAEFDENDNVLDTPDFSSTVPGGRFPRPGPDFFFDESGLRDDFSRDEHGFAFRPLQTLRVRQNRYYGSVLARFEIADTIEAFSTTHVALMDSLSKRAPELIDDGDVDFEIPLDNPFVPEIIADDAAARGEDGVAFARRMSELGRRTREAERLTLRHWTGVRGVLGERYRWETAAGYGRHAQDQSRDGLIHTPSFANALNAERDPATGAIRCADAEARAQGCVPVNLFGLGAVTPAAARYVGYRDRLEARLDQITVSAFIEGSLLSLPAGPIDGAAGLEWRRDSLSVETDPATEAGFTTAASVANFDADQSAFDLFTELRIPVSSQDQLIRKLTLQGAARVTRFSEGPDSIGVSYNAGAAWTPIRALKLDGRYARSIREPDLTERFSPARGDTDTTRDPCDGLTAAEIGARAVNCRADPGVNQAILEDGVFDQGSTSVSGPNLGNPDLLFEIARSWSMRAVIAPELPFSPKLSVEYFNTKVDRAIESLTGQQTARQCYLRTDAGRDPFCALITRDATGQLAEILNPLQNLTTIRSEGVENEASLSARVGFFGAPADLELIARHLRLLTLDERFASPLDGGLVDIDRGEPGAAKDKLQLLASLFTRNVAIRWRTQYESPTIDADWRERFFRESNIDDPLFFDIPANWRHDIYIQTILPGPSDVKIYFGVNNLFDNTGPFFPQGTIQGGTDNHISEFDVVGRFFFTGVEIVF